MEKKMTRQLISSTSIALVILLALAANADARDKKFDFVGLWQGIDAVEGDVAMTSITPNPDGTMAITVKAKFRFCPEPNPKAFSTGSGTIQGDSLVSEDRVIFCGDGIMFDPSPTETFTPVEGEDLLDVMVDGLPNPVIRIHRISAPRKSIGRINALSPKNSYSLGDRHHGFPAWSYRNSA
jgi:hypothetical protein